MKKLLASLAVLSVLCSLLSVSAVARAAEPFGWMLIAQPHIWHVRHTLTVLDSGEVLAVGQQSGVSPSAEVYSPAREEWETTGDRIFPLRRGHAAVKLPGGAVLLCGGREPGNGGLGGAGILIAELYDPARRSFQETGGMSTSRSDHTASGLRGPDGEALVLAVGGFSSTKEGYGGQVEQTAEVYDAATGQWTAVEPMSTGRALHTATWIEGLGVLVAGGVPPVGEGESLSSAELWDPVEKKWRPVAWMKTPRFGHTATLLSNRKVLVVGGADGRSTVLPLASVELYDPDENSWTELPPMTLGRDLHAAVLLSADRVLVTGGRMLDGDGLVHTTSTEIFDAETSTWHPFPQMTTRRADHRAVSLGDDAVLVMGGPRLASTELLRLRPAGDVCAQGVECRSGFCADGVCCDAPCGSPCATCLAAEGAARDGTCFERSCAPYTCGRSDSGPVCLEKCSSDNDCALGYACEPGSSTCVIPRSTFVSEGCAAAGHGGPFRGAWTWILLALLVLFVLRRSARRGALRAAPALLLLLAGAPGCESDGDVSLCGPLLTACLDRCVDTGIDRVHCGACGNRCDPGELCFGGECAMVCGGGSELCGDRCVDILVDPGNCGGCGAVCAQGQICLEGACALPAGLRSYIFPGVTAPGGVHAREPDFVIMADAPATIHYTTDGSLPAPGEKGTMSERSPVTISGVPSTEATQRWIRWFAHYDVFGPEVEVRSYLSVTEPALQTDFDAAVPAPRLGVDGLPLVWGSPGDKVVGEIDYEVWSSKPGGYCPGCVVQIVAGLEGDASGALGCSSSGAFLDYPGNKGTFAFERMITAPPGRYVVRRWLDLASNCEQASQAITVKSEDIGLLIVR